MGTGVVCPVPMEDDNSRHGLFVRVRRRRDIGCLGLDNVYPARRPMLQKIFYMEIVVLCDEIIGGMLCTRVGRAGRRRGRVGEVTSRAEPCVPRIENFPIKQ